MKNTNSEESDILIFIKLFYYRKNFIAFTISSYANDLTRLQSPDEYRTGAVYVGFGPIQIGSNSEKNRHVIQNKFAHDKLQKGNSPWFKVLDIKPKFYFNFGNSGSGNGLW